MPSMSVSVRAETLEAARAEAAAAGLTLSAWVDRTLAEAVWTRRFAHQQERNAALGITTEYLNGEFARLEELRRRAAG
ncbi:hypothetical protein ND748_04950 [Frankia sp. AiPs1]|uniref:hypothetical protein n=1 Tax=Frankia sp. AiPs1 TaxID=573493 RepID=UPI002042DC86|nr:hypothetical protein [Frankia sp. AiPs1]MCM3921025.1 hypothetical protein [Frankia sp. AiPs1]